MKPVVSWMLKRGPLLVSAFVADGLAPALLRSGCNPFYPYLIERIDAAIDHQ